MSNTLSSTKTYSQDVAEITEIISATVFEDKGSAKKATDEDSPSTSSIASAPILALTSNQRRTNRLKDDPKLCNKCGRDWEKQLKGYLTCEVCRKIDIKNACANCGELKRDGNFFCPLEECKSGKLAEIFGELEDGAISASIYNQKYFYDLIENLWKRKGANLPFSRKSAMNDALIACYKLLEDLSNLKNDPVEKRTISAVKVGMAKYFEGKDGEQGRIANYKSHMFQGIFFQQKTSSLMVAALAEIVTAAHIYGLLKKELKGILIENKAHKLGHTGKRHDYSASGFLYMAVNFKIDLCGGLCSGRPFVTRFSHLTGCLILEEWNGGRSPQ